MSANIEAAALETDSITWGRLAGDGDERISYSYFGYQFDRLRHFEQDGSWAGSLTSFPETPRAIVV